MSRSSLPEIHRSVAIPATAGALRKLMAFAGPGYLVAVGYMDPGNWATALAGGSAYGYTLLSVALTSSLMAMLLQVLCARLGIVTGRDLAQLCRERFPKPVAYALWGLAEIAIVATDLAELIGTAIALQLLFGVPLIVGVLLTALDAFLILWLQNKGVRWLEAVIISMIALILGCFTVNLALSAPEIGAVLQGYIPSVEIVGNPDMLYLAIGILGATVMPHNLYLHTAVVQSRAIGASAEHKREAIKFASLDSTIALTIALVINSSILILAAATFHTSGRTEVAEIQEAYQLLAPLLGAGIAATLFAVALLASGLNSTVTATMAGQVVMQGFLQFRLPAWAIRLTTRLVALVPAVTVTWFYQESGTAELLVLSQVVLSLQLPFAVVPLMLFVGDRKLMGDFRPPAWMIALGWASAALVVTINVKLLADMALGG
ncbi:MAG TPA: Nramp family divalent metal transporter [Alphaproteobacteria bacterium]|nr:Nramp family divalent metal transporter [Alphaproteobacteria bacterium]